ncbi:hypothetical protein [Polyangium jinanense]|uniref:Outer membrane protein beta-barrel domain-containing protein n=1 Tax=Polyangium jinanense TaxID=2829994 RepID=A0A9X3WYT2_9BACT|nr:hypothetical protein [Polyangium jinanense]MDC3954481.1 hypothetical protein [Polyangium jinanense]MDC3980784.1 hypothetical protein [Polyangium jinanense]
MRRSSTFVLSLTTFVLVGLAAPAFAQESSPEPLPPGEKKADPLEVAAPPPPTPPPQRQLEVPERPTPPPPSVEEDSEEDGWANGDHFEFTMGFLAGQRSYSKTSFKFEEGTAEGIGGGGLVEPFVKAPFDAATVLGLRYDLRLVMSHIRMTVGFDVPFPTYKVSDSTAVYNVSGTPRTVTVQSLSAKELRFGIGGEYAWTKVAIFADLLGGIHWVDTELAIDGYKADYGAMTFAFSGRAGARAHVRKWFFASVTGEVGIIGDIRWNAELSVGFFLK